MILTLFLVPCLYFIAEGAVAGLRRAVLGAPAAPADR